MLKLLTEPLEVWWPLKVTMPTMDGQPQTFECRLRYRVPLDLRPESALAQAPLSDLIADWEGIIGPDDQPLPCSAENKALFFGNPFCLKAANEGLSAIYAGEYRRKNS